MNVIMRVMFGMCVINTPILGQDCNCGTIEVNVRKKRIVNGNNAIEGRYPWHVYIEVHTYQNEDDPVFMHGKTFSGTLISVKHIITCHRCLDDFYVQMWVKATVLLCISEHQNLTDFRFIKSENQFVQGIANVGVHDTRQLNEARDQNNELGIQFHYFYQKDTYRHESN